MVFELSFNGKKAILVMIEDEAQSMLELAREGADILRDVKPSDVEWNIKRLKFLKEVDKYEGYQFN